MNVEEFGTKHQAGSSKDIQKRMSIVHMAAASLKEIGRLWKHS